MQVMPTFQAQIPHPLIEDLPTFLPKGTARTPPIRILFLILVAQNGLKSPAMKVERHDIGGRECLSRQTGEKEFRNHPILEVSNRTLRPVLGRDDHPRDRSCCSQTNLWEIKESTTRPGFWVDRELGRRQSQSRLDLWPGEQTILFASQNPGQPQTCEPFDNDPIAIQSIQSHQAMIAGYPLRGKNGNDALGCTQQLCTIVSIACPGEGSHPLMGLGLQDRRTAPAQFAAFAPQIPFRTDRVKAALGRWQVRGVGKGTLSNGLSGGIHIKNDPAGSQPIPQPCLR